MECYDCGATASGICIECGIAVCHDHGQLIAAEREVSTSNVNQRVEIPSRRLLCDFDARANAAIPD